MVGKTDYLVNCERLLKPWPSEREPRSYHARQAHPFRADFPRYARQGEVEDWDPRVTLRIRLAAQGLQLQELLQACDGNPAATRCDFENSDGRFRFPDALGFPLRDGGLDFGNFRF